jgi:hypothetical protein
MAQLVGLPCSMCGERIGNTFESAFCEKCGNPVHNRCREPMRLGSWEACAVCGAHLATARRAAAERERQRREEEARRPPPPPLETEVYSHYNRIAKWFLTTGACLFGGIYVMTLDEPGATVAGVGATLVGITLGMFGLLAFSKR